METEMETEMEILSLACEIIFGEIDVQACMKQFFSGTASFSLRTRHKDSVNSIIPKCRCLTDFICRSLAHMHSQAYALLVHTF